MSEKELREFLNALEKVQKEHASSPEKAREFLKKSGVLTPTGRLSKNYAAEPVKPARKQTHAA